jgi:hypothetical protein
MSDEIREIIVKYKTALDVVAEEIEAAEKVVIAPDSVDVPTALIQDKEQKSELVAEVDLERDIRSQLADMTIPQKIKLALFGNAICRSLLILDASKMIQQFVLKNPKLGMNEVEAISKNTNVSESVLRTIADSRVWMKTYAVKLNIVMNPKTPGDVSLKWLRYVQEADLRRIAKSKNLPSIITTTAKKRVAEMGEK